MPGEECIHLIDRASCAFCMPRRRYDWSNVGKVDGGVPSQGVPRGPSAYDWLSLDESAQAAEEGQGAVFPARKDSTCPGCGGHIRPGDPIHYDAELEGYACGGCARFEGALSSEHSY